MSTASTVSANIGAAKTTTGGAMSYEPLPRRTPGSVTAAAVLLYISCGLGLIASVLILVNAANVDENASVLAVGGLLIAAVSIAYIVAANRLRRGDRTARTIVVVLAALAIVLNLFNLPQGALSIVLSGVIIYLLMCAPESNVYFGDR
ncbi:hypothetical protein BH18ACT4_BH18ACT4_01220 [soil metagenome]